MHHEQHTSISPWLLFVTLVLLAFLGMYFGGVTPGGKVCISIATSIMGVMVLAHILSTRTLPVKMSLLIYPVIALTIAVCLSQLTSIDSYHSTQSLSPFLAYFLLYIMLIRYWDCHAMRFAAHCIILIATSIACFGIGAFIFKRYDLWWFSKTDYLDRLTGSFINPNHCACFIATAVPWCIYFIIQNRRKWLHALALCILLSATILTFSYTGIFALLLSVTFLGVGGIYYKVLRPARYRLLFLIISAWILLIIAGSILCYVFHTQLMFKLYSIAHHYYSVVAWWNYLSHTAHTQPLTLCTGIGMGNLQYIINTFYPYITTTHIDHIHNDMMELLIEGGIVGLIALVSVMGIVVRIFLIRIQTENEEARTWLLCTYASLLILSIHLCLNFILSVPAIAVLIVIFLIFIDRDTPNTISSDLLRKSSLIMTILLINLITVYSQTAVLIREHTIMSIRGLVKQRDFKVALEQIDGLLYYMNSDIHILNEKGEMHLYQGVHAQSAEEKLRNIRLAQHFFNRSLTVNPFQTNTYIRMADSYRLNNETEAALLFFKKGLTYAPQHLGLRLTYIDFLFTYDRDAALAEVASLVKKFHIFTFQNMKEKLRIITWLQSNVENTFMNTLLSEELEHQRHYL